MTAIIDVIDTMLKSLIAIVKEWNYSIEVLKELNLVLSCLTKVKTLRAEEKVKEGDPRIPTSRIGGVPLSYLRSSLCEELSRRFQEVVVEVILCKVVSSPLHEAVCASKRGCLFVI